MEPCPQCGQSFELLGKHWNYSEDHRPNLSDKQYDIITGVLMGDGTLCKRKSGGANPILRVKMISSNYLKYIDEIFGCLGTGVKIYKTAKENAKSLRDSGFSPSATEESCSDVYVWRTRSHPEIREFSDWYSTGSKVFPNNIDLTPTVLKHWYCCDGNWDNKDGRNYIRISMTNEFGEKDKINKMFENVGLSKPSNYDCSKPENSNKRFTAQWNVDTSQELWDYMGEPLPDFEYKWPEKYH